MSANPSSLVNAVRYLALDEGWLSQISAIERTSFPSPWSTNLLRAEFRKEVSVIRGLVAGKTLVAYAFSHFLVGELHILSLAVRKDHRRQGFGALLLSQILEEAAERGGERAMLEVRYSNTAAQELYFKHGFEKTRIRKRYYRDNHEDALVFEKILNKA